MKSIEKRFEEYEKRLEAQEKEMVSINPSSCDSSKSFHSNRAQALLLVSCEVYD